MAGVKSVDALRNEADAFLAQDDPEAYAELVKQRRELKNESLANNRGSVTVDAEARTQAGSEGAVVDDGDSKGQDDVVRTGLSQIERDSVDAEPRGSLDVPDASVPTVDGGVRQRSITSITMVNGARFSLGEFIPWKGIFFQVIELQNGTVTLQAIGLTNAEIKRMLKARSNA